MFIGSCVRRLLVAGACLAWVASSAGAQDCAEVPNDNSLRATAHQTRPEAEPTAGEDHQRFVLIVSQPLAEGA